MQIETLHPVDAKPAAQAGPDNRLAALARSARNGTMNVDAVRAAAEEFEGVFLANVFETLHQGIDTNGPFGGGQGEAMFRSMLIQEHAKAMTNQGGIGLADQIVRELQRIQEV